VSSIKQVEVLTAAALEKYSHIYMKWCRTFSKISPKKEKMISE